MIETNREQAFAHIAQSIKGHRVIGIVTNGGRCVGSTILVEDATAIPASGSGRRLMPGMLIGQQQIPRLQFRINKGGQLAGIRRIQRVLLDGAVEDGGQDA